jgi:predicted RNA-binding protein
MDERKYWLALFTTTTWQEFLDSGADVYGLSKRYRVTAACTKPGDYLLCYVAGISRFIGLLEVLSRPFSDTSSIWSSDIYPLRLRVKVVLALTPETAVPVKELMEDLSVIRNLKSPSKWAISFRISFKKWLASDARTVIKALEEAKQHPIARPVFKSQPKKPT